MNQLPVTHLAFKFNPQIFNKIDARSTPEASAWFIHSSSSSDMCLGLLGLMYLYLHGNILTLS